MSAIVKLMSRLPADDKFNGLDQTLQALLDDPHEVRVALVRYDVPKITEDTEDDVRVPYVRIRGFEPVGTTSDVEQAVTELLQRKIRERTGQDPLPLDVVEDSGYVGQVGDDDDPEQGRLD